MRRLLPIFASLVFVPVALYACSSDESTTSTSSTPSNKDAGNGTDTSTPPRTDDGGGSDTSTGADTSTAPDTSMPTPVRCTQADFDMPAGAGGGDFTTFGGVDISFPTSAVPAQYSNHCAKVKVGASITFAGKFSSHPLAVKGGDTPSPIPPTSTNPAGGTVTFPVPKAGTFGYECALHPATMFGALQVVP